MNMPTIPNANPIATRPAGRKPPGRAQSNNTTIKGSVAINNAVNPEGTVRSASTTAPLPPSSNNPPMMSAVRQFAGCGRAAPRSRAQP
jgi:hypothetical protein